MTTASHRQCSVPLMTSMIVPHVSRDAVTNWNMKSCLSPHVDPDDKDVVFGTQCSVECVAAAYNLITEAQSCLGEELATSDDVLQSALAAGTDVTTALASFASGAENPFGVALNETCHCAHVAIPLFMECGQGLQALAAGVEHEVSTFITAKGDPEQLARTIGASEPSVQCPSACIELLHESDGLVQRCFHGVGSPIHLFSDAELDLLASPVCGMERPKRRLRAPTERGLHSAPKERGLHSPKAARTEDTLREAAVRRRRAAERSVPATLSQEGKQDRPKDAGEQRLPEDGNVRVDALVLCCLLVACVLCVAATKVLARRRGVAQAPMAGASWTISGWISSRPRCVCALAAVAIAMSSARIVTVGFRFDAKVLPTLFMIPGTQSATAAAVAGLVPWGGTVDAATGSVVNDDRSEGDSSASMWLLTFESGPDENIMTSSEALQAICEVEETVLESRSFAEGCAPAGPLDLVAASGSHCALPWTSLASLFYMNWTEAEQIRERANVLKKVETVSEEEVDDSITALESLGSDAPAGSGPDALAIKKLFSTASLLDGEPLVQGQPLLAFLADVDSLARMADANLTLELKHRLEEFHQKRHTARPHTQRRQEVTDLMRAVSSFLEWEVELKAALDAKALHHLTLDATGRAQVADASALARPKVELAAMREPEDADKELVAATVRAYGAALLQKHAKQWRPHTQALAQSVKSFQSLRHELLLKSKAAPQIPQKVAPPAQADRPHRALTAAQTAEREGVIQLLYPPTRAGDGGPHRWALDGLSRTAEQGRCSRLPEEYVRARSAQLLRLSSEFHSVRDLLMVVLNDASPAGGATPAERSSARSVIMVRTEGLADSSDAFSEITGRFFDRFLADTGGGWWQQAHHRNLHITIFEEAWMTSLMDKIAPGESVLVAVFVMSFLLIFLVISLHSVPLGIAAALQIFAPLPIAFWVCRELLGFTRNSILNLSALPIIAGIGVDDVIVYHSIWRAVAQPSLSKQEHVHLSITRAFDTLLSTSFTTALALLIVNLTAGGLEAVAHMSSLTAVAALVDLVSTLTVWPALVLLFDRKTAASDAPPQHSFMRAFYAGFVRWLETAAAPFTSCKHRAWALVVGMAALTAGVFAPHARRIDFPNKLPFALRAGHVMDDAVNSLHVLEVQVTTLSLDSIHAAPRATTALACCYRQPSRLSAARRAEGAAGAKRCCV